MVDMMLALLEEIVELHDKISQADDTYVVKADEPKQF